MIQDKGKRRARRAPALLAAYLALALLAGCAGGAGSSAAEQNSASSSGAAESSGSPSGSSGSSNSPPASASAFPASSASSEATGTCSAGAAFSLPSEASPACTSAPSSISGASGFAAVFRGASSFVCGAAAPPALSCAASPLLSVSEAPLDMLKVSPVKALFSGAGTCVLFPFAVASVCSGVSRKGCTPSACWISSCGVFFLEAAADACTFPCSAFFAALPFFFACLLDATCSFSPADQSIKPGARETRSRRLNAITAQSPSPDGADWEGSGGVDEGSSGFL